jgi:hypothetical protein
MQPANDDADAYPAQSSKYPEQPAPGISDAREADEEAIDRTVQRNCRKRYYDDLAGFGWFSISRGILFAAFLYPLAVTINVFLLFVVEVLFNVRTLQNIGHGEITFAVMIAVGFSIVAGLASLILASMAAAATLPIIHLVVWSLKIRPNWVTLGAFAGGLVGFLAVLSLATLQPNAFDMRADVETFMTLWLGPGVATIVGQYGGAVGGRNACWRLTARAASRRSLIRLGSGRFRAEDTNADDDDSMGSSRPWIRFRTVHLLWVGVWLSLLLTAFRLSGVPNELILPVLLIWTIYQAATLRVGSWLLPHLAAAWRAGRQIRST